jgi:hypothetical protein
VNLEDLGIDGRKSSVILGTRLGPVLAMVEEDLFGDFVSSSKNL